MVNISRVLVSSSPFASAVVDGTQHVDRWQIPLMYQQIHSFDIGIVRLCEVSSRIVIHYHRHLAVGPHLCDKRQHVVSELCENIFLVGSTMNALIAKRKSEDDILAEVSGEVVIPIQQINRVVAIDSNAGYTECIGA